MDPAVSMALQGTAADRADGLTPAHKSQSNGLLNKCILVGAFGLAAATCPVVIPNAIAAWGSAAAFAGISALAAKFG